MRGKIRKIGTNKFFNGKGYLMYVGVCPHCQKKHFVDPVVTRQLVELFHFENKKRFKIKLPKFRIDW